MPLTCTSFSITYVIATIPCRSAASPSAACDEYDSLASMALLRVKLVKKLALVLDGIDLTPYSVGEEFACSYADGALLVREGWAESVDENGTGLDVEPPSESIMAIIDRLREGLKER